MTDLQRRRELAKLAKPQLIDLLIHAEAIITPAPDAPQRPYVDHVFQTMKVGMP